MAVFCVKVEQSAVNKDKLMKKILFALVLLLALPCSATELTGTKAALKMFSYSNDFERLFKLTVDHCQHALEVTTATEKTLHLSVNQNQQLSRYQTGDDKLDKCIADTPALAQFKFNKPVKEAFSIKVKVQLSSR